MGGRKSGNPVEVFYSYSHKDEKLRDELENHLSILKRDGVITGWHDCKMGAGRELDGEIDAQLDSAAVILLLVSADFLASDYCYDIEAKRAMEWHESGEAVVIPVILRSVDWKDAPFSKLKALPKDAKPVTSWINQDEAFTDVARGIRRAIEELNYRDSRPSEQLKISRLPAFWNIPHIRNKNFTGREDILKKLWDDVKSGKPAALTALHGLGGVGKTQIATEYVYLHKEDYKIIWWIRSEDTATLAADYASLAGKLDLPEKEEKEIKVTVAAVRDRLDQMTDWLLVFDNAEKPEDLNDYLPRAGSGHVLITTRNPAWGDVAEPLRMETFNRQESIDYLLKRTKETDKESAALLSEILGDLPLALAQAAAYMERKKC